MSNRNTRNISQFNKSSERAPVLGELSKIVATSVKISKDDV